MPPLRRTALIVAVVPILILAFAACGDDATSPSAPPSPSAGASTASDLSAISCATEVPEDVGPLTGAWAGSRSGIYYIRHVGDCLWWFGTELDDIEPGVTGQPGFANVASGRVDGTHIEVEWVDLPTGDILGGGGLTLLYDEENDQLEVIEQRGDWVPFGDRVLTRIQPSASPDPGPSASARP